MEELSGTPKEFMLGRGNYEYALPFFGERKPILIDLLDMPDEEIVAFYKYVRKQGDKIYAESFIPSLYNGRGAHLWGVAAPLFDRSGNRFGSIEVIKDVTENVQKEEERLRSEKKYREILEEIDDGYYEVDLSGNITFFNNALCRILGYDPGEMAGMNNRSFMDRENARRIFDTFHQVFLTGRPAKAFDWELIRKTHRCTVETSYRSCATKRDSPWDSVNDTRHHGARITPSASFTRPEMESIGRLTGGIATTSTTFSRRSSVCLNASAPPSPDDRSGQRENIIHSAGVPGPGAPAPRLLLKQTHEDEPQDLNSVITNFEKILRRTLHEDVAIRVRLDDTITSVLADVGQVEQIIMNLAINAQDAMPSGGTIFLQTSRASLDDAYVARHKGSTAGEHVLLTVSDTGSGMDSDVLSHLFEPFFTTKGHGIGPTASASSVYGIVKQHGGYIMVYSEPGRGTTFRIYFPCSSTVTETPCVPKEPQAGLSGTETIMVVEDELLVRNMITGMLDNAGFNVIEAGDGKTALELLKTFKGDIHLIISDIVLPDTNGTILFETMSSLRPGMKVLYMSGYTPDVITHTRLLEDDSHFIQKPFTLNDFANKVRLVLDGAPASGHDGPKQGS
jgi:PAS domain S-box-containing protein